MSRSQELTIEQLQREAAGLREKVSELAGELRGVYRGERHVTEQLATDLRRGAVREEQHRAAAQRAAGDVQRLLRLVAGHVLDVRQGSPLPDAVELFVDDLALQGFPLRGALVAVQVERADTASAAVRVTAAEAAQAVVSAP